MGRFTTIWPGWVDCGNGLHQRPDGVLTRQAPPRWPTPARRIIVCGGRDFVDWPKLANALETLHYRRPITILVHGGAPGADKMAGQWALQFGLEVEEFPAAWKEQGPSAGPERNQRMVDAGAHGVIAFPGGRGTADCCRRAEAAGIKVWRPYG